jgi:hypothetical protein
MIATRVDADMNKVKILNRAKGTEIGLKTIGTSRVNRYFTEQKELPTENESGMKWIQAN